MNSTKRFLSLVLTLAVLVGTLVLTTNASDSIKSAIGIVDASGLRLREGPGTDTEILTTAYRDDYVVILEAEGDWYKVIYNLREGYMHSDYLVVKERENVELGYGRVNSYLVNLRSNPTTSSEILDQLSSGEEAYIIGFNCGWYKVQYDGSTGYIRSDLLDLTEVPYENTGSDSSPKYFVDGDPISSGSQETETVEPPVAPAPPAMPLWRRPRSIWAFPMCGAAPLPADSTAPALPSMSCASAATPSTVPPRRSWTTAIP